MSDDEEEEDDYGDDDDEVDFKVASERKPAVAAENGVEGSEN